MPAPAPVITGPMIMQPQFYTDAELDALGIVHGRDCRVSKLARIYATYLSLGDGCRIDDFAMLTGTVSIGRRVHIPPFAMLYGKYGIVIGDYSGVSPMCTVYSESDDYSGKTMLGPCVPDWAKGNTRRGRVVLEKFSILGHGCTVLPGVTIGEGAIVGAHGFVRESLAPWTINVGSPARFVKARRDDCKALAAQLDAADAVDVKADTILHHPV